VRRLLKLLGIYKLYEKWLYSQIKGKPVPSHVAIILDGNRRWARRRGLPPWYGHEEGARKAKQVLRWLLDLGVTTVTLYVLSTENLRRDPVELSKLFEVIEKYLRDSLRDPLIFENEVKFKAIGKLDLLPKGIRDLIAELEDRTRGFSRHFLNVAIAYGGRSEIVEAVRKLARDVRNGKVDPSEISEELFEKYLFTSYLPNPSPDLIVRTSGEERLSNFLLWQSAYSELCFLDVYWPEFRRIDLLRAIRIYQRRARRFGL